MSGLCKMSKYLGAEVCGSDANSNEETEKLKRMGVHVFLGHMEENITKDIDLVVYSGAIKPDNCELQQAQKLHIKCMERSQFLGIISSRFKNVIAISGTHGKTTTSAMIGTILHNAKFNPTIHLGGESVNLNDNTIIGGDKYLVVEACEYRESFRFLNPNILVITNIDADHLDYYKDISDIKRAFQNISDKSQFVIKNEDVEIATKNGYIIGKDFQIINEKFEKNKYTFSVNYMGKYFDTYSLNMFGRHNVINALFAIAVCEKLGVEKEDIKQGLEAFAGVKRRYEQIGKLDDIPIIIDYAHHPTEIKNSIAGINSAYKNPLIIFQPHTYSRTKALLKEFLDALRGNLIVFKTYPAREKEMLGGRAIDLFEAIDKDKSNNANVLDYCDNEMVLRDKIEKYVCGGDIDCVLILGAGDLAEKMRKYYK